ncbi:hypothetical protein NA56DRAFT_695801 [Hyaloscypha hepaticicola]|uniref:Clr5 domain-containing protein n=1 Tax=Hyaloscypha hepaticicola TaxID=2082293 RepID=A0A2J6PDM3_9HELO|nr:hypothetical protein NA56DRAFT_695801 [Hyaloscypha hepaticicola]
MDRMKQEHGLLATAKMYKSRLAKWHFVKNNNSEEMESILRELIEQNIVDQDASYRVNGKLIEVKEVARYFRRKGFPNLQAAARRLSQRKASSSTQEVSPFTISSEDDRMFRSSSPGVVITTPEHILRLVTSYYTGCCEATTWYTCPAGRFRTVKPIKDSASMIDSSYLEGRQVLSRACERVPQIVQAEHPNTVRAVLEMVIEYNRGGFYELAVVMLKHFLGMADHYLSCNHPLTQLFQQLLRLEANNIEHVAILALDCGASTLALHCGAFHYNVIRCQIAVLDFKSQSTESTEVESFCKQMLQNYIISSSFSTEGYLNVAESLIETLCKREAFEGAENIAKDIGRWAQDLDPDRRQTWTMKSLDLMSRVQFQQNKFAEA